MGAHYTTLLAGAASEPDRCIATLPMLSERELLDLERWNAKAAPPVRRTADEMFAAQVARTPHAVALVAAGASAAHAHLSRARRACQRMGAPAARAWGDDGIKGRNLHVALAPPLIVAILAVLKAGGAYVPLDPRYPPPPVSPSWPRTRS